MKITSIQQDLSLLYNRAKKKFEDCIGNEDNEFLKVEVGIPLDDIIIIEKDIKIVFSKRDFEYYLFEVSLMLFDKNKEIGKYLYIENQSENAIDDSLIFY